MRKILAFISGTIAAGAASAHAPDDLSVAQALGHQVFSLHHLPVLLLVVIGLAVILATAKRTNRR